MMRNGRRSSEAGVIPEGCQETDKQVVKRKEITTDSPTETTIDSQITATLQEARIHEVIAKRKQKLFLLETR